MRKIKRIFFYPEGYFVREIFFLKRPFVPEILSWRYFAREPVFSAPYARPDNTRMVNCKRARKEFHRTADNRRIALRVRRVGTRPLEFLSQGFHPRSHVSLPNKDERLMTFVYARSLHSSNNIVDLLSPGRRSARRSGTSVCVAVGSFGRTCCSYVYLVFLT